MLDYGRVPLHVEVFQVALPELFVLRVARQEVQSLTHGGVASRLKHRWSYR